MVKLVLYGAEDKPVKTLVRYTVRWGTLKRAQALKTTMETLDAGEQLDAITALVADCFEGDTTFEEIEKGARAADLLGALTQIIREANVLNASNFHNGAAI